MHVKIYLTQEEGGKYYQSFKDTASFPEDLLEDSPTTSSGEVIYNLDTDVLPPSVEDIRGNVSGDVTVYASVIDGAVSYFALENTP